jgi:hypothetical protein
VPGSAKAWALVSSAGTIIRSSGNLTVIHKGTGLYCVRVTGYTTQNAAGLATLDWSDPAVGSTDTVMVANQEGFNSCDEPKVEFEVLTWVLSVTATPTLTSNLTNLGFAFMIP